MGTWNANFSPRGDKFAPPYSKSFSSFAGINDLRTQAGGYPQHAAALLKVLPSTTGTFVYKDSFGNSVTIALTGTVPFDIPGSVTTIEISTMVGTVIAYWNPQTTDVNTNRN